jgi:hypothetical protein
MVVPVVPEPELAVPKRLETDVSGAGALALSQGLVLELALLS